MFGAFVPARTLLRAGLATAVAAAAVALVSLQGKIATLFLSALAVAVYVGALLATGELGPEERAALARVVARRRGRG
jgi:hypothetical protein